MKALAKNSLWLFGGQCLSVVVQAGYFIALARLLGRVEYGIYISIASLSLLFSQFATLGSGFVLLQFVSSKREFAQKFFGNLLLASLLAGPVCVLLVVVAGHVVLQDAPLGLLALVAASDCLLGALVLSVAQAFQAVERMSITATLNVITNTLRFLVAIWLLYRFHTVSVSVWAIAVLCVSAVSATMSIGFALKTFGRPHFDLHSMFKHVGLGLTFAFSASTTSVYNDVDKVILGHYGMEAANGIYSLAYRCLNVFTMPMTAIYGAAFPRFFQKGAEGIRNTLPLAKKLLLRTTAGGVLLTVIIYGGAFLIPMIVGQQYQESALALRWLCIIPLFRSFQWCAGDILAGSGRQRLRLYTQIAAALLNLALNLYLIPRYSWRGAALASLLTDGSLALMNWGMVAYSIRQSDRFELVG